MPIDPDNALILVYLSIALIVYFGLHSWLASLGLKNRLASLWPRYFPAYRLLYNLLAVVLLLPILWLAYRYPGPPLWQWHGGAAWLMHSLGALAVLCFLYSLRSYDKREFLGWTQWQTRDLKQQHETTLNLHGLHRFVRHPWYACLLVIMWTRDMHLTTLWLYTITSLYLLIGSRLEESKLIARFGEAYVRYRLQVPGLLPLPWRYLKSQEAETLMRLADTQSEMAKRRSESPFEINEG